MKQVYTRSLNDNGWQSTLSPLWSQSAMSWSETSGNEIARSQIYSQAESFSTFPDPMIYNIFQLRDTWSGAATIAFYNALQGLSRSSIISSNLIYTSSFDQLEQDSETRTDILVNMPPLSTKKVVMRARYTGPGEPLALLDPLPED